MQWRTTRHWLIIPIFLGIVSLLLAACGTSSGQQPVTLTFSSWQGGAAGDAYQAVIKAYEKLHPNVTIQYEVSAATDYTTILNTHFSAGDPADIVAFSPTSYNKAPYVQAGDLVDLSDQPWVAHLTASTKITAASDTDQAKIYALPTVQDMGGVIYNKDIFSRLHLQIPTTWAQFIQVCQAIKAAGIAPLAVGAKDGWPLEQFLYNELVNTVYRTDPTFHTQQVAGTETYAGSAGWKQAINDLVALEPYFNTGFSSTDFAGTTDLLATGKAAMSVNGDFTLQPTETNNPNIHLGIFPLPYVQDSSTKPNLTTFVDVTLGVSAKSHNIPAAKQFLQYFAQPDVMASFLTQRGGLATLDNVGSYKVDPALTDALPLLGTQALNEAVFGTTSNVETTMWKDAQAVLTGSISPTQMLQDMDQAFKG
ncbi:MAG TPA: ABC transporter substrate-binding protein [Ktedonobacterales bacterium]|nr:ABC transporter substrate-binding protein [Ktedonobacterales bacterium]